MIVGALSDWQSHPELAPFKDIFEFLVSNDLEALTLGRHDVCGDECFVNVDAVTTRTEEVAQFETHRRIIDLHVPINSEETIGYCPRSSLPEDLEYDSEKDLQFYASKPENYTRLAMKPGMFAIFYPEDAHLPMCRADSPVDIKKIVGKISVSRLKS